MTYESLSATTSGKAVVAADQAGGIPLSFTVSGTIDPERIVDLREAMKDSPFNEFLSAQTAELLRLFGSTVRPIEIMTPEFRSRASEEITRAMTEGGLAEAVLTIDPPDYNTFLEAALRFAPTGGAWELRPGVTIALEQPAGAASWQLNTALGLINESEKLIVEAEVKYLDALAISPLALPPMERLMAIYMAVGEWAKLQRVLDAALTHVPTSVPHLNWAGLVLLKRGDLTNAERLFTQGLDLEPDNPLLLGNVGTLLMKTNRIEEAGGLFERAVNVAPESPQALFNYGSLLAATDRFDEALPYLQRAEGTGRLTPQLARTLSIVLEKLGNSEEAAAYREKASLLESQGDATPGLS